MQSGMFAPAARVNQSQRDALYFFTHFPPIEYWRFFIERCRYDYAENLYYYCYHKLFPNQKLPADDDKSIEIISAALGNLTVNELYRKAEDANDENLLCTLDNLFHLQDRKNTLILDFIHQHYAWLGFEANEPGYLLGMARGLRFIVDSVCEKRPFTISWIKELHKICTQHVKKMLPQTAGEFRQLPVIWAMTEEHDSEEGLLENLKFAKQAARMTKQPGVHFLVEKEYRKKNNLPKKFTVTDTTSENDLIKIRDILWRALKDNANVHYCADLPDTVFTPAHLHAISLLHINQLEISLKAGKTYAAKLYAIYTYLKATVLQHAFQDGEGRTFSMAILFYLCMRENLIPVIPFDSNDIPGLSVKELVYKHILAERDMMHAMTNPDYISSHHIHPSNVRTKVVISSLSTEQRTYFNHCLLEFCVAQTTFLATYDKDFNLAHKSLI